MAFKKSVPLPTGVSGDYIRLTEFQLSLPRRYLSAEFALFKDQALATSGQPLLQIMGKLRVMNDYFDIYFAKEVLKKEDVLAQIYRAARDASEDKAKFGDTNPEFYFVSDFGKDFFANALVV